MDEVELKRAMKNLRILIGEIPDQQVQAAMLTVAHVLHGLNERMEELETAISEDDD